MTRDPHGDSESLLRPATRAGEATKTSDLRGGRGCLYAGPLVADGVWDGQRGRSPTAMGHGPGEVPLCFARRCSAWCDLGPCPPMLVELAPPRWLALRSPAPSRRTSDQGRA